MRIVKIIMTFIVCMFAVFSVSCAREEIIDEKTADNKVVETYTFVETETLFYYEQLNALLENLEDSSIGAPNVRKDTQAYHVGEENAILHAGGKAAVPLDWSLGFPFIEICSSMHANPFSNFNILIKNNLIEKVADITDSTRMEGTVFDFTQSGVPLTLELNSLLYTQPNQEYSYSQEGCESFVKAVITLAKTNAGNLNSLTVDGQYPTVYYSQADNCYYSFVLNYNTSYGYITAIYLRSEDDKVITDVTLQNLSIAYPTADCAAGASIGFACEAVVARFEVITLITSIEQTLTGNCYLANRTDIPISHDGQVYTIPLEYQLGDYKVNFHREEYVSPAERKAGEKFEQHLYSIGLD